VLDARLTNLLCKKNIVVKSKGVKAGCNLAKSSNGGFAREVLLMMMMKRVTKKLRITKVTRHKYKAHLKQGLQS
jgi:hypothetical protein